MADLTNDQKIDLALLEKHGITGYDARTAYRAWHHRSVNELGAEGYRVEAVLSVYGRGKAQRDDSERPRLCQPSPDVVVDRHVKVRLDLFHAASLLDLPRGARVVRLYVEQDPAAIYLIIDHPDAEPLTPGTEAPYAHLREEHTQIDGATWSRRWVEVPR